MPDQPSSEPRRPHDLPAPARPAAGPPRELNLVHAMAKFARMVRYRKAVLIVILAAAGALGALQYTTEPRRYESTASLLILGSGEDAWSTEMSGERVSRDLMPTYQNLIRSEVVLEEAIKLLPPAARVDMGAAHPDQRTELLRGNLTVTAQRGTNIMDIAYRSASPQAAASVVGSVVTAYMSYMDSLKKNTGRELLDVLTRQKVALQEELRAKEAELAATRAASGELVLREGNQGTTVAVRRALSLNEALIRAREKRLEAQTQLAAIEATIRNGGDLKQLALSMVDEAGNEALLQNLGLSTASDGGTIAKLKQQLLADAATLQNMSRLYGPAHTKVQEIQQRIQVAQQYLATYRQNATSSLNQMADGDLVETLHGLVRQQLSRAIEHENALAASYDQEKTRAIELDRSVTQLDLLERELARLRSFYDVVVDRIKNIDLGQDASTLRASVISQPEVPKSPVSPQLKMVVMKFGLLGLLLGLGLIYVLDVLDDRFRSPEDIQSQLQVPVLAMIRKLDLLEGDGVDKLHVHVRPGGAASEAFRTLRTALALTDGGAKSFVMSSAEPGDGKTTVMANLAAAFAQTGQRTLLVDADMRRPGLTAFLDLRGPTGLSAVLRDDAPIAESVQANLETGALKNLDVLPAGPRQNNAMQLLANERFSELLSWADSRYDQVLVDGPPALAVSDAAMIGRLVDGVLLTVRPEKNRRREVIRAVEQFRMLGVNVIGTVLNHMATRKDSGYYGYGDAYGYEYGYGGDHEEESSVVAEHEIPGGIRPTRRNRRTAA
jgi:capsular exopolysaccharide synthesis family protein